jgi:hypothetical protein
MYSNGAFLVCILDRLQVGLFTHNQYYNFPIHHSVQGHPLHDKQLLGKSQLHLAGSGRHSAGRVQGARVWGREILPFVVLRRLDLETAHHRFDPVDNLL